MGAKEAAAATQNKLEKVETRDSKSYATPSSILSPTTVINYYNYGSGPQIGSNSGSVTGTPSGIPENSSSEDKESAKYLPELPEDLKAIDYMWEIDEKTYEIKTHQHSSDYTAYYKKIELENNTTKTILSGGVPISFPETYVNSSISYDIAKTRQASRLMAYVKYLKKEYADALTTITSVKARLDDADQIKIGLLSRYTIITGSGGMGKSMLLRHLLLDAVSKKDSGAFIPIFTSLKDFNCEFGNLSTFIYNENKRFLDMPFENFHSDLRSGGFLILLDGLDEVSYQNMVIFDKALSSFIAENPSNQIVMSSRPYTDFVSYKNFTVLKLLPLRKEQSIELIEKTPAFLKSPEVKREFVARIKNSQFDNHADFISNPLLLTIMFMTFEHYGRIADRIHIFYNDAFQTMYWKHDRDNNHNLERNYKTGFDCDTFAEYLSEFCAKSYFDDKFVFSWNDIDRVYQNLSLNKKSEGRNSTSDFVDDLADNLCLMYRTNDGYDFYHRSFQEYFCALYFSRDKTDAQLSSFAKLYSDIRSNKKGDQTFGMLYDMIPSRIEASVFLPFLKELLRNGDRSDYLNFLICEYPHIDFETGETPSLPPYAINSPVSYLYDFIASHYHFSHDDADLEDFGISRGLPLENIYTIEKYLRQAIEDENDEDDDEEDYNIVSYSELGLDINTTYSDSNGQAIHPCGSSLTYPLDEIFSLNPESDTYKTLNEFLTNPECPLMIEYNAALKCYEEMKKRVERSTLIDGLFD
ncbi:MAG: hypothetical protein BACD_00185 [Bacteroides rodentium]